MAMSKEDLLEIEKQIKPKGLHGCSCHPFNNWKECEAAAKQKFTIGQTVINRHTKQQGIIIEKCDLGYYRYKCGELPRDITTDHAQMLILLKNEKI